MKGLGVLIPQEQGLIMVNRDSEDWESVFSRCHGNSTR